MRVAVVTRDVVGARMAGPGIRAFHLAEELARHFDVTLVAAEGTPLERPAAASRVMWGSVEAKKAMGSADLLLGQPVRGFRASKDQRVVYDLFAPVFLELAHLPSRRPRMTVRRLMERYRLDRALRTADLLVVATPSQRELYSGVARSRGIDVRAEWITVPFGIENDDPPGGEVDEEESLFIWNGGVWPWLDPETAIEAVSAVRRRGVGARLLFLGGERPGAAASLVSRVGESVEGVDWNSEWVRYGERWRWLRPARAAVMLHHDSDEARYSIRTRFFDALWCRVPVIATRGGWVAELVEDHAIGIVVEPGDVSGVADAMALLCKDDEYHARSVARMEQLCEQLRWRRVVKPLVEAISKIA